MHISDSGCKCETCQHSGHCVWQDSISNVQEVMHQMRPRDELTVIVKVKECKMWLEVKK